jgi:hypothetical protein
MFLYQASGLLKWLTMVVLELQLGHSIRIGSTVSHSGHVVPGLPKPEHSSEQGTSILPLSCRAAGVGPLQIGHLPCSARATGSGASPATSLALTDWILSSAPPNMN